MKYIDYGNEKRIIFDELDSDTDKRIIEQGLAFMRNLLIKFNER